MKIICPKSELLKGVTIVQKAVPTRTTMTILECILINATTDRIRLTANDTELGIETVIQGRIEERGMIALDAKYFSEIVRKLPDNDIVIDTGNSLQATITCENSVFTLVGKEGEDFTPLPYVEKDERITLSQFKLKEVIRQTIFSILPNDSNKIMTGELFDLKENRLQIVSLDGHRVSVRNLELHHSYEPKRVIVPGKSLQEISKIMSGEEDEPVDIYVSENLILFEIGDTSVVSRLIEGNYFMIDQLISSHYETKINVNRRIFLESIERGSLFASETDKRPVIMDITDDTMELKIRSMMGSMNEKVPIRKEGASLKIGFNPKFFIDALRVIDDEEVTLYMINPKAPCFIRDAEETYIYLILPVNFNENDY